MQKKSYLLIITIILILLGCSSSQESTTVNENKDSQIYVFDDVDNVDTSKVIVPEPKIEKSDTIPTPSIQIVEEKPVLVKYAIQLGAFTTMDRADSFIKENQNKLDFMLNVSFNEQVGLYVVKSPHYTTREETEKIRNQLWQISVFKDAFIVTERN